MYMGHFGIAIGSRKWLRPLPMAWLLFASVEPDLHDALGSIIPALDIGPDTHTIPGIACAAFILGLLTAIFFRSWRLSFGAGALVISHLAVDLITSRILLWRGGPSAGLHLYAVHWADFVLETAVVCAGLYLYSTSPDLRRPVGVKLIAMGAVLIVLQAIWNFGFGSN